jgi:hypothetical protein
MPPPPKPPAADPMGSNGPAGLDSWSSRDGHEAVPPPKPGDEVAMKEHHDPHGHVPPLDGNLPSSNSKREPPPGLDGMNPERPEMKGSSLEIADATNPPPPTNSRYGHSSAIAMQRVEPPPARNMLPDRDIHETKPLDHPPPFENVRNDPRQPPMGEFSDPGPAPDRKPHRREPMPQREDGKYEIQPNDSYWTISEKVYGSGGYFKALAEFNRSKGIKDERLVPGEQIETPMASQLEQNYPDLCPKASHRETPQSKVQSVSMTRPSHGGRTYMVMEGDTLFNIARYELGKASRWAEIYELNRDVLGKDFNYLVPGTQLTLPQQGDKPNLQARQTGNGWR